MDKEKLAVSEVFCFDVVTKLFRLCRRMLFRLNQARNQLVTPGGGRRVFRGAKFFTLCPKCLKYFSRGVEAPLGYGPGSN